MATIELRIYNPSQRQALDIFEALPEGEVYWDGSVLVASTEHAARKALAILERERPVYRS